MKVPEAAWSAMLLVMLPLLKVPQQVESTSVASDPQMLISFAAQVPVLLYMQSYTAQSTLEFIVTLLFHQKLNR